MTTRRKFITLAGGAAAWPLAARAQQPAIPVVGFLNSGSPGAFEDAVSAFRQGLVEAGYVEHRNVGIEYRWAEGQVDRLPAFARELVRAQVAVICAGSPPAALATKAATTTIPIVFTSGEDPIKLGLVASYNRPGGNVTGIALLVDVLGAKRLGLLREIVPAATLIAVLLHPSWPTFETQLNDVQEAARAIGQQIHVLHANTEREIDAAFDKAKELRASVMMVGPSNGRVIEKSFSAADAPSTSAASSTSLGRFRSAAEKTSMQKAVPRQRLATDTVTIGAEKRKLVLGAPSTIPSIPPA